MNYCLKACQSALKSRGDNDIEATGMAMARGIPGRNGEQIGQVAKGQGSTRHQFCIRQSRGVGYSSKITRGLQKGG